MESRFLVLLVVLAFGVSLTGCARDRLVRAEDTSQPPVIEPDIERREIEPPRIDTEDFEVGIFAGQLSVEDFGVNTVTGARFAYHVTEGFFVELAAGQADTELTSFERLSGASPPEASLSLFSASASSSGALDLRRSCGRRSSARRAGPC